MSDNRNRSEMTRRTMLALAGSVGASGIVSGRTQDRSIMSELKKPVEQTWETKQVVGPKDWMYDTIQGAHDDLEGDGGHIYVTEEYDSSPESFPVVLTKSVRVEGANRGSTTVDARESNADVFVISEPKQSYSHTSAIENLRIRGGNVGITISPDTHVYLGNLILFGQESHGVLATQQPNSNLASFSTYLEDVNVMYGGGNGIDLRFKAQPHATVLQRCTSLRMDGHAARLTGTATAVISGTYQYCGKSGITVKDCSAVTIRDNYLEGNGKAGNYSQLYLYGHRELMPFSSFRNEVMGANAPVIEGNYFMNTWWKTEGDSAIHLENTHGAQIRSNAYYGFHQDGKGFLFIDETCSDIDYARASNWSHNYAEALDQDYIVNDEGYRTRSDGLIQPTDLSTVEGLYEGDKALDDGTNTESHSLKEYYWRDGAWQSGAHRIPFEGRSSTDASVTFEPGEWDGHTITVDSATLPDGGFVGISDLQGDLVDHSDYLAPGTHENIVIEVNENGTPGIVEDDRHPTHWLAAMLFTDSNDNEEFDWEAATPEQLDEPYHDGTNRIMDGGKSTVVVPMPDGWEKYEVRDNVGHIEPSDAGGYDGPGFVAPDPYNGDPVRIGAFKTVDSTDFDATVYINSDIHDDDSYHHGHGIYLGSDSDGTRYIAGPVNPSPDDRAAIGIRDVTNGNWVDSKSIDNWPKHTWLKLDVSKSGTDVSVTLTDPSSESELGTGTFSLPADTNSEVGVHGTSGYGQECDLYFDGIDITTT